MNLRSILATIVRIVTPTTQLSEREIHWLLADPTRSDVVTILEEHGPGSTVDVETIVAAVAAEGADPECERTTLVHAHLPRLVDAGVITWDRAADTVTVRASIEALGVVRGVSQAATSRRV